MKLDKEYFAKSALFLSQDLLGKFICRNIDGKIFRYQITETECYFGYEDTACHASKGKTPRNEVMFSQGGVAYIYLCYGIHYLLNIVTGEQDFPQAVLIRGIDGANGPGKLTKLLQIDKSFNWEDLCNGNRMWLEDDGIKVKIKASKRIGIDYAMQKDIDRLWRYQIEK